MSRIRRSLKYPGNFTAGCHCHKILDRFFPRSWMKASRASSAGLRARGKPGSSQKGSSLCIPPSLPSAPAPVVAHGARMGEAWKERRKDCSSRIASMARPLKD
eukprot:4545366-Pleurochrysis_carterae.AAC.3